MSGRRILPFSALLLAFAFGAAASPAESKQAALSEIVRDAVRTLMRLQEPDGKWPYDDSHDVGFDVANTSLVAEALLLAAPNDAEVRRAAQRALAFVIGRLELPAMAPKAGAGVYNQIWGYTFGLEFLCRVRERKAAGAQQEQIDAGIARLVQALMRSELSGGGWSYSPDSLSHSFVTAAVAQALLLARARGEKVPDAILMRSRRALEAARSVEGGFAYDGKLGRNRAAGGDSVPGSAARSPLCEATLMLLGAGSIDAVWYAVQNFFKHWNELEKCRQQPGTHQLPYHIAPYYFYYGHRYTAQAIQMLPEEERAKQNARLLKAILQTRDGDGAWNDRDWKKSKSCGTAMAILALLASRTPLPPTFTALSGKAPDRGKPALPSKTGVNRHPKEVLPHFW